jgi:two-component system, chemotaxis family, chemotaxis protein CheY
MSLNVLVVDDSAVMRSIIIKNLRASGIPLAQVFEAGDGAEALWMLTKNHVDLALVDINMPVMNGEELINKLRQNPRTAQLPVIVVSTEGSETRITKLRDNKAGFVHKPFTPEKLKEKLWDVMGVIS